MNGEAILQNYLLVFLEITFKYKKCFFKEKTKCLKKCLKYFQKIENLNIVLPKALNKRFSQKTLRNKALPLKLNFILAYPKDYFIFKKTFDKTNIIF